MLLTLVSLGLLLVVYQLFITNTIDIFRNYQHNKIKASLADNASAEIARFQSKLIKLQKSASRPYNTERLLKQLTAYSREHGLLVRSFPEALRTEQEASSNILTNQIEVEGGYKAIVGLVYMLEQSEKLGSISSLHFFLSKDRIAKKVMLRCLITVRNIET